MAVSKRLRYEILRRDGNACRYCGGVAPDVQLTIDHVIPAALGGTDDPENLVAACRDCNSGKSATPPGATLTAGVSEDAFRWATALRAAYQRAIDDIAARDDYLGAFLSAWERWTYGSKQHLPLPNDWERSVAKWYALGLPIEILRDAVSTAMSKQKIHVDDMFRYVAGIVWRTHEDLQRQVAATLAEPTPAPEHRDEVHCHTEDSCDVHGILTAECIACNEANCTWYCGYLSGFELAEWLTGQCDIFGNALRAVCDGRIIASSGFMAVSA